jgi:hypothetical protein
VFADDELGPRERGSDVNCCELPDRALSAAQPSDVEAVDPDQLAGLIDVNVLHGARIARRLIGRGIAGDERETLRAGVQTVTAEHLPHRVWGDNDAAPLLPGELRGDTLGPETGMSDREAENRSSTIRGSWLGISGRRRSRGLSISRP